MYTMQVLSHFLLTVKPTTLHLLSKATASFTSATMASNQRTSYQAAVETLNSLQSPGKVIMNNKDKPTSGEEKLKTAESFLKRIEMEVTDIDGLSPIHIAGTKGKGSVSALCESILGAKGYKTGFFSSPHLLEVRERIRINGRPISKDMFVRYFWEVFNKLKATEEMDKAFPRYFSFLCLLCYKVFLQEKVDVAIIEVGIGGSYDVTNIIRRPKVCGITSLGYDHMDMLGSTLPEIAWHKSGIFKPGSPAITAPQPAEALEVIRERAKELGSSSLMVSPDYTSYPNHVTSLGINGDHQLINTSLAVQVCKLWLSETTTALTDGREKENDTQQKASHYECGIPVAEPFTLPPEFIKGLNECKWPGRCQVINKGGVAYFLDTAHTNRSIRYSVEWFERESTERNKSCNSVRVLLFHFSGKRDASFLMDPLIPLEFQYSVFCPNIIDAVESSSDYTNLTVTPDQMVPRARENALLWKRLHEQDDSSSDSTTLTRPLSNEPLVFESISKAVQWIQGLSETGSHVQVLVCGSTFLVGGVMKCLGYDTDTLLQYTEKETKSN